MSRRSASSFLIAAIGLVSWLITLPASIAQHSSEGSVSIVVVDASGSVVQGADLQLVDVATGSTQTSQTQEGGTHTFVNLPVGTYRLSISKQGFKSQVFDAVSVQATKTTGITATMGVGTQAETVEVTATASPLIETTSSAIGTVIDMKQIEDLPIQGRNLTQMTQVVPGYTGTLADGGGTWNGLPSIAQGNSIDGVTGSAGRMKFGGAAEPAVEPRVENIQEMTVQTDQLDLNQGYGTSTMQINFVTRRGTNAFHGRIFEDFRNSALNANDWTYDFLNAQSPGSQPRPHLILNEFGASVGGPVIRNKLFFFGTYAMSRQPGATPTNMWVLTPAAQAGNFTYSGGTVNVFNLASSCGNCGSTALPTTVNGQTQSALAAANSAVASGTLSNLSDPNFQQLNWQIANPDNRYFPTVRVDYEPTSKQRVNVAWNYTKRVDPGAIPPNLPGSAFAKTGAGNKFRSYTAALGFTSTLSPTFINEFHGGFLYNANFFGYNGVTPTPSTQQIGWNFSNLPFSYNTGMNGTNFPIPTGSYYPVFNASDTVTWQKHAHTIDFGFSWWREQNHYYNGVLGFPGINLGLASTDPAINAFTTSSMPGASGNDLAEAQELYAVLVGRVSGIGGSYTYNKKLNSYCEGCIGAYNLDELQKSFGGFFQDSYRVTPTFVLNYGLRWDFTWPDYDLTGAYHSAAQDAIWGPSGVNNIFAPGVLKGTNNPILTQNSAPAKPWYVSPQPTLGFAWNPRRWNNTVLRAGFSLRRFTEPQQYFWNQASDYGAFYFQSFSFNPLKTGGAQPAGTFAPGTLALGDPTIAALNCPNSSSSGPVYSCNPAKYLTTEPESDFTFLGGPGANGVAPNLKQPYTESWNVGIQRQLGESRALEIRYIGNRSLRQWIVMNQNEVNIFENGFLSQFKIAQQNLAAYIQANPGCVSANNCSFANNGLPGQQSMAIFNAAFAGEGAGPDGQLLDYSNGGFVNNLQTGQAGALANTLANTAFYFCNMVGSAAFAPCANNVGINVAGAGYPINFFQVNPYAIGTGLSQLVSEGYSNYNGLQVDFRQRAWHGLQFDANYTWSHTLGVSTQNNWQGAVTSFTLRDMHLSYGPTLFDIRHSVHISGTYDLPLGKGKTFSAGNALDRVIGGWTIGTIFTLQTGNPFLLQGGYNTFNDYADGGVVLNNVTVSQLQSSVGVYHIPGQPSVSFINPKYLASSTGGGANPAYISPNTTPGTIGQRVFLYGPRYVNDDLSLTKRIPITERWMFSLQAMALNAFNHPTFQPGSGSGCSYFCYAAGGGFPNVQAGSFAIGGVSPSYQPRILELRGNIEF